MLLELEGGSTSLRRLIVGSESEMATFHSSGSGAMTEDITDIDEPPKVESKANSLMSLLSGKQNKNKPKRGRKPKVDTKTDSLESTEDIEGTDPDTKPKLELEVAEPKLDIDSNLWDSSALTEELSEVTDTSFDAMEFERKVQRQRTLAELELKVFKEGKLILAKDFLKREKKVVECVMDIVEEAPVIEVIDEEPITKLQEDPVKLLEQKFASKRAAARDLFSSFAPKRTKNSKGDWTLKVKLRLDPSKLAAIKQFENPLMSKGNTGVGKSLMSTLMGKRPSLKVKLTLPTAFLKEIQRTSNPLYTKSSGNQNGKRADSVFAMMMQTASQSAFPKLTPIQRLTELMPPPISRSSLHVCGPEELLHSSEKLHQLPLRKAPPIEEQIPREESIESLLITRETLSTPSIKVEFAELDLIEKEVSLHAPLALTNSAHKRIYEEFILAQNGGESSLNWPQKFQPPNLATLLLPNESKHQLQNWMENAFAILSTQSTKTPRNVKLREQAKKQRKREAEMNFIVDDDYDEGEETEEDVFVPVLIISGETGSCKSSSVYAAMNALDGYVHEINAGQQRSRKDLYGSLKEFCTTQIINQNLAAKAKTFLKGVVLFEDCDILFEQDKTFWTVVQDVVNFSKRPIVITVTEPEVIPRNIWDLAVEQNSIIHLANTDKLSLLQYLWLCAYSHGYNLSAKLQDTIMDECKSNESFDLRKAIMSCQWLCCKQRVPNGKIVNLDCESDLVLGQKAETSLEEFADQIEVLSAADVISENTTSKFIHDSHVNELLDIFVVHDSLITKQPCLTHELNIGNQLQESLHGEIYRETRPFMAHNQFREIVTDFISSRKKRIPRFVRELQFLRSQTRSRSSSEQVEELIETQPLPDTSTCYSMSPLPFFLDLAPITRQWSRFQKTISAMDVKYQQEGQNINLESFLGWRRFYSNEEEVLKTGPSGQ